MNAKDRLILALDYSNLEDAKVLVEKLGNTIDIYKVGLELFLTSGGKAVDYLHKKGKKVFLDLKFHDIPNTVEMASRFAVDKGVFMFNVHASGGKKMMGNVSRMIEETGSKSIAIAVTILTSFSEGEIEEQFKSSLSLEEMVMHFASLTKESGMHGVVCSPLEAGLIKKICGKEFKTICPGVRPAWSAKNDQQRIMTPKMAIENGADFLVVGRPIRAAEDPAKAAELVLKEIEEALEGGE